MLAPASDHKATEDHLYQAMDWLLARQPLIEKKLAARHLRSGSLVLYEGRPVAVEEVFSRGVL